MEAEDRSELGIIFYENRDKARLKKVEIKTKLDEFKAKLESLEEEMQQLDSTAV
jgi:hypothetical protein